jgi:hypothetical protein
MSTQEGNEILAEFLGYTYIGYGLTKECARRAIQILNR